MALVLPDVLLVDATPGELVGTCVACGALTRRSAFAHDVTTLDRVWVTHRKVCARCTPLLCALGRAAGYDVRSYGVTP